MTCSRLLMTVEYEPKIISNILNEKSLIYIFIKIILKNRERLSHTCNEDIYIKNTFLLLSLKVTIETYQSNKTSYLPPMSL